QQVVRSQENIKPRRAPPRSGGSARRPYCSREQGALASFSPPSVDLVCHVRICCSSFNVLNPHDNSEWEKSHQFLHQHTAKSSLVVRAMLKFEEYSFKFFLIQSFRAAAETRFRKWR